MNSEGESTRDLQAEWDWQGPAQLEPESQVLVAPQFVDVPTSDIPPELDFALPRWMRAPEHGPPEELEFEAGSGPANDRE